jgi:acyl carrier protein
LTASVPDAIATAIRTVLHDTGRSAREVESSMLLATDLGLDSLDLAQTIVLLERSIRSEPRAGRGRRSAPLVT